MFELGLLSFLKKILSKITLKGILIFAALCVVAYGIYRVEQYGEHKQAAIDAVVIKKANDAAAKAIAEEKSYQDAYANWVKTSNQATADLKAQQAKDLAAIQKDLDTAKAKAQQKQIVYQKVTKYVTATDDAHCTINTGFVQLFNGTLEGSSAGPGTAVSGGIAGSDDTPTTLKLSQLASVIEYNNIEAVQRGIVIKGWQDWYAQNKASFDAAQQKAAEAIPKAGAGQ